MAISPDGGARMVDVVDVVDMLTVARGTGPELGVTTAREGGRARSDMRFPQFVQNMIPVGLSHSQLPQRMPPQ